ncbi:MAG: cytochrome c [Actinomycetia bacterium]|nr:cytochrome c [Actinomycetes bacterium]
MRRTGRRVAIIGALLALVLAACVCEDTDGGSWNSSPVPVGPGDPIAGARTYTQVCSSCHGADLQGVDDLGTRLSPSDFIADQNESSLALYIRTGREADDPDNVTGVLMPPSGGAPWLSDQDIVNTAAYLLGHQ